MEALRRVCVNLLILAAATTLVACNLATIHEPLDGQRYPSEPVDIFVALEQGADPGTFEAYLAQAERWVGSPAAVPPWQTALGAAAEWLAAHPDRDAGRLRAEIAELLQSDGWDKATAQLLAAFDRLAAHQA